MAAETTHPALPLEVSYHTPCTTCGADGGTCRDHLYGARPGERGKRRGWVCARCGAVSPTGYTAKASDRPNCRVGCGPKGWPRYNDGDDDLGGAFQFWRTRTARQEQRDYERAVGRARGF